MKKIELQACYVPQMKAENMYNSYSGIKNRILKEKKFFFEIFYFLKILKKLIFVKNFEIFEKISKMASRGLFLILQGTMSPKFSLLGAFSDD